LIQAGVSEAYASQLVRFFDYRLDNAEKGREWFWARSVTAERVVREL